MPRVAREKSETGIYHVMIRGINKQIIFQDDEDRYRFISTLKQYRDMNVYKVYSYCLMDNHVHMLLEEDEYDISSTMKKISSSYVFWYNKKYQRCGHLFQDRFKSEPVNSETYLLTVLRYIHRNPIKARMTSNLRDYKWSSYIEFINENTIVEKEFILDMFSNNKNNSIDVFEKYHTEMNEDTCLDIEDNKRLSDKEIKSILNENDINFNEITSFDKVSRDEMLRELKKINGSSIRQISRITGISKNIVARA